MVETGVQEQVRAIVYKTRRNAQPILEPPSLSHVHQQSLGQSESQGQARVRTKIRHKVTEKGVGRDGDQFLGPQMQSTYHNCLWVKVMPFLASISLKTVTSVLNIPDKPSIEDPQIIHQRLYPFPSQAAAATNNQGRASISQLPCVMNLSNTWPLWN